MGSYVPSRGQKARCFKSGTNGTREYCCQYGLPKSKRRIVWFSLRRCNGNIGSTMPRKNEDIHKNKKAERRST
ncbi:hypothetical protein Ocin01_11671 [Orchesella cincta]|uniref:Uncharacterized protein n=1 Tax=Orchesella cincta TaxID=48709 RepID=A0A1D2MPM9_ORCCI|nr:hypothetical protein Ocin01_11671 [Orchesella cincta]